jgi:hypothetical protein
MSDQTAIPTQLSVDDRYPGFRDDAVTIGCNLSIAFDGTEQRNVVAYDLAAGSLTRARVDEHGNVCVVDDEIALETVSGYVEVWHSPAP